MNPTELVLALIAAALGGGGVAAIVTAFAKRRKIGAEADSIKITGQLELADRALDFNRELLHRVETLEKALAEDEAKERELEKRIAALEDEVRKLERENESLRSRCRKLEEENAELRENGT